MKGGVMEYIDMTHVSCMSQGAFSEHDILELNDLLLTNGLHTITVKNIAIGRKIVDMFVTLLNRHQQIYWLSPDTISVHTHDLYDTLKSYGPSIERYEAYFYEEFYADLLIIECTQQLLQERWYTAFEQALMAAHITEQIPVVQLLDGEYQ